MAFHGMVTQSAVRPSPLTLCGTIVNRGDGLETH